MPTTLIGLRKTITVRFPALGTTIEGGFRIGEDSASRLVKYIQQSIALFSQRFNRFLPTSELSQLNARTGQPVAVSGEMFSLLMTAQRIWKATDGLIDPTIGQALINAGYDIPFGQPPQDGPRELPEKVVQRVSFADVSIDQKNSTVTLPLGTTLDFGGLGKGFLLDQLTSSIERETTDYWLSFGGDILVNGSNEAGQPWAIGVQNPQFHEKDIARLVLPSGRWGIATSGTTKRKGIRHGRPWHHLIDPRTQKPSVTNVLGATVVARTALEADCYAKVVLLLGSSGGLDWARQKGIETLAITNEKTFYMTELMKKYLRPL